jgi:NOL1/NOP2/fmu family ribosome biogenesis protein
MHKVFVSYGFHVAFSQAVALRYPSMFRLIEMFQEAARECMAGNGISTEEIRCKLSPSAA